MGKLIVSENISLDGVIEDPTGEGAGGRGNWFGRIGEMTRGIWAEVELNEALGAEALLMGRRSYEWFLARGWATSRTGAWADRLRSLPKYVVSSSALQGPEWGNVTVLKGDVPEEVGKLKEQIDGDIVLYGSGRLVRTLWEHNLVDELRLMTYPVVVGTGERLFTDTSDATDLRLINTRPVGEELALHIYQPVR